MELIEYGVSDKMLERLKSDYTYHKPTEEQPGRYTVIRNAFLELAIKICMYTPESREQSVALTQLELACFAANAAIARNEK